MTTLTPAIRHAKDALDTSVRIRDTLRRALAVITPFPEEGPKRGIRLQVEDAERSVEEATRDLIAALNAEEYRAISPCANCGKSKYLAVEEEAFGGVEVYCSSCIDVDADAGVFIPRGVIGHGRTRAEAISQWNELALDFLQTHPEKAAKRPELAWAVCLANRGEP